MNALLSRLIAFGLRKRWLVFAATGLLSLAGVLCFQSLAVEAYPDLSDTTAQVITQYPGHAAEEVEEQLTIPLERELNGVPGVSVMRSRSTFGLSLITLVFRDGIEDYWARSRIRERLAGVELPDGVTPELDPLTSAVGEIYRYSLEAKGRTVRELTELQTWVVIPTLKQVQGVADVSNFGGETTEFQIALDPARLAQFNLSLQQVTAAIKANNANAGGSLLVRGEQAAVIRGLGLVRSLGDLGNIVVASVQGTPIFVKDLGQLQLGALARNGIAGKDEAPDVVTGIVLLLRGSNPSLVLEDVHRKVDALNAGLLPPDVKLVPYLDRTVLVNTTLHTVLRTLLEGMGLVVLVLLVFLGSPRSALLIALTVPLCLLGAFVLMALTDVPANLLSLGAIDFGILVDGAIVVLESVLRRREQTPGAALTEDSVKEAATQVARPMLFAAAIIGVAYLPLFAFQRVERKLFLPMAQTVGCALAVAVLLALVLVPALSFLSLRAPGRPVRSPVLGWLTPRYQSALGWLLARPRRALVPGALAVLLALGASILIGREYLPELDEGSLWLQVMLPPGISLEKASELAGELRRTSREEPQVSTIVTQLGRTDDGMDPWTPSHIEAFVGLTPAASWPQGLTKRELVEHLERRYRALPGVTVGFSQPIFDMVNDKIAGAHSELVVKLYASDLTAARPIAGRLAEALASVPGAVDVAVDQEPPLPQLQVEIDRLAAARYGLNVADIGELIEVGVGGKSLGSIFQAERRHEVTARFLASARGTPQAIGELRLTAPDGQHIPLSDVAKLSLREGESTITRENNRRHLTVRLDLRGRDLSDFLADAQARLAPTVAALPPGMDLAWGGQFETQHRAQARLAWLLPLVLAVIFLLLYGAFGSVRHAAMILVSVPLALLGGMLALHLRGMTLNVSSAVGFIALFGIAVQNGVIMVSALDRARDAGLELSAAVLRGALERLRPVVITATVATLGLLPAALATGVGSDVQRPLATVVVGGLITATLLTLLLLPVLYLLLERWQQRRARALPSGVALAGAAMLVLVALPAAAQTSNQPESLGYSRYVEQVLALNPDLAGAREGVSIAHAQLDVARVFPDAALTLGANQVDLTRRGNPTLAGAQLSVPLELGGKRGARVAVAGSGERAARADLDDALRGTRAAAALAFTEALHARLVAELKAQVRATLDQLVEINVQRLRVGEIPEVALVLSRVEARQFQAEVLDAEGDRAATDLSLFQLLGGREVPAGLTLEGDLRAVPPTVVRATLEAQLEARPDLRAARTRVEQAGLQVELEKARRVIDVSVGASWQHQFAQEGVSPAELGGLTLTVPLPLSRIYRGELDAALAAERQAKAQLDSVRARARSELGQALVRYQAAAARVSLYDSSALADADSLREKMLYNYQHGGATLVEYLVAQRAWSDVRLAWFDALADRARALATLEQAAGGAELLHF